MINIQEVAASPLEQTDELFGALGAFQRLGVHKDTAMGVFDFVS